MLDRQGAGVNWFRRGTAWTLQTGLSSCGGTVPTIVPARWQKEGISEETERVTRRIDDSREADLRLTNRYIRLPHG